MDSNKSSMINTNRTRHPEIAGLLELLGLVFFSLFNILLFFVSSSASNLADFYDINLRIFFWILTIIMAFVIFGGISSLRRKAYPWALIGGIFTSCVMVGIPALVLLIHSRNEFTWSNKSIVQIDVERIGGKSRTVSVLLAVFLAFFTWLYTYKKDGWKFWVGFRLLILAFVMVLISNPRMTVFTTFSSLVFDWLIWAVPLIIWLWSVADAAAKNNQWYKSYG